MLIIPEWKIPDDSIAFLLFQLKANKRQSKKYIIIQKLGIRNLELRI